MKMLQPHWGTKSPSTTVVMLTGNIGVGKKEIAEAAGERFGWDVHIETAAQKNPWLASLNDDIDREILPSCNAFRSEVFFLAHWAQAYLEIIEHSRHGVIILDHCPPFDSVVFADNFADLGLLEDEEWDLYQVIYNTYRRVIPPPDLLVYLYTSSAEILLERIRQRDCSDVQDIEVRYLDRLDRSYAHMVSRFDHTNRISINVDHIDLDDPSTFNNVLTLMHTTLSELGVLSAEKLVTNSAFACLQDQTDG